MKKWKQVLMAAVFIGGIGVAALPATQVSAVNVFNKCKDASSADNVVCKDALDASGNPKNAAGDIAKTIVNTMLVILGILAVIMIVFSGIRYTISSGDASKVKGAKDTLTYSIVGLVVALLAWTIVNFVIGKF